MTRLHLALLFVLAGGVLLTAGLTWLTDGPWALIVAGVGLIAGGLFAVDLK